MQETTPVPQPPSGEKGLGFIWRLAQIVLVMAAAYLYFYAGSLAGLLQRDRLFSNPHTEVLIKVILVGIGIGLCVGMAIKDLCGHLRRGGSRSQR
jgi:hypothetical protein